MSAAYRLAANAPRIAAAAIFANPYVRIGVGIATWLGVAKVVWDAATGTWRQLEPSASGEGGNVWMVNATAAGDTWHATKQGACNHVKTWWAANDPGNEYVGATVVGNSCVLQWRTGPNAPPQDYHAGYFISKPNDQPAECPQGWTSTPAGCVSPALTQPQFIEELAPLNSPAWPMPETVPKELPPGTPLPVDDPFINPAPGPNPGHRPLFVPTGDPLPNPNYDPNAQPSPANQPYIQPGIRVLPSPTPDYPWRVDIQPTQRPVPTADPSPEPTPEDAPNPGDKPTPQEQQSLCEKHPDIVACAKTGSVEAVPVANQDKQLAINKDTGYGPESGTCPAPKTATVMGQPLAFKYDLLCDFAGYIKPLLIAFAWLSAALTFFGFSRKDA